VDFKALSHKGMDFEALAREGKDVAALIGQTDYINFKALGYKGDPIKVGGRFGVLPFFSAPQGKADH
jgi:hypothetical protein